VNPRPRPQNNVARWLPVAAAGGLLVAVVVAGVISGSGGDDGVTASSLPPEAAAGTSAPVTVPFATQNYDEQVVTASTDSVIVKTPLDRALSDGVAGDDVSRVQQRLHDLAFDPGPIDGIYGLMTKQSVYAFEKLVMGVPRTEVTGRVTPEMWDRMQDPIEIRPRRPTGGLADHTEIYLPEQVMVVFHSDVPALVTHISTGELDAEGNPAEYCETITLTTDRFGNLLEEPEEKAICGRSKTPPGVFEAYRQVEGTRVGPLGAMWNPIYINQGIAIHGARTVPVAPASHGCIRVPMHISETLQGIIELGDKVLIWDGKKEPEDQSERDSQMLWDYPDPNATTTTSTTTSTTTTTTSTTIAPSTTQGPPATTTTSTSVATTTTTVTPTTTQSATTQPSDDI
jgi:hypothetical protein